MARLTGYWWSPRTSASRSSASTRARSASSPAPPSAPRARDVFDQRYPVAGSANALVELFVMDPDGGNRVKVDLGAETDIYLARVDWAPDGARSTSSGRTASRPCSTCSGRSGDRCQRCVFTENAAVEDYWINLSTITSGSTTVADLVVRARRLRASLSLCRWRVDTAHQGRVDGHQAGRRSISWPAGSISRQRRTICWRSKSMPSTLDDPRRSSG